MNKENKSCCVEQTEGTIVATGMLRRITFPYIKVRYYVGGRPYVLIEAVNFEIFDEVIDGVIGGGVRAIMRNTSVGTKVTVMFDPEKPKRSYIKENEGAN